MILTKFRRQTDTRTGADEPLVELTLSEPPAEGEIITVEGVPYVVVKREWAYAGGAEHVTVAVLAVPAR